MDNLQEPQTIEQAKKDTALKIKNMLRRNYFWNDTDYDKLIKEIERIFKI